MPKFLLLATALLLATGNTFGQQVIFGNVTDAVTHESLPYTNVYVNHTTVGTVADQDGKYTLTIPRGEYELVYSFVGYQTFKTKTSLRALDSTRLDIKLLPAKQQLDSVVIRSTTDKEWEKLIKQFKKVFLGTTQAASHCIIRNPWCIDLKKEKIAGTRVLVAHASQPIEIENYALGYKLFYDLQDFYASKQSDRFSGNVYFTEMEAPDSLQAERWAQNRHVAYYGSSRHLFKSILDQRVKEEGFTLTRYQTTYNVIQQNRFSPTGIMFDSLKQKYIIPMLPEMTIYYKTSVSSGQTLVGGINFTKGFVEVDDVGAVADPLSIVVTGYLGRRRVANLLPNDYRPTKQNKKIIYPSYPSNEFSRYQLPDGTFVAVATEEEGNESSPVLDSLENTIKYFSESQPSEKVYVHLDKPFYFAGEDSWYKAYVVNASDLNPTAISSVLYLDWIDPAGKLIKHHRLKIENGAAVGDFSIDSTMPEGLYTVRAYTNWMRNGDPGFFYSKKIPVYAISPAFYGGRNDQASAKIDLQFFPEGGTVVVDELTSIAFKAVDINGKGTVVKGKIVDEQNNLITTFQSIHNGMGKFPLIADGDKTYFAMLPDGERFALPLPATNVLSLSVSNLHEDRVIVRIRSGKEFGTSSAYLIAHSRGSIYHTEYINLAGRPKDIVISKDELPEGILQLTVFNGLGIPQCERMVFIRKNEGMAVSITSDKKTYAPRDSVTLTVEVNDFRGYPVETSLSVSVTDDAYTGEYLHSENIYTRLLLQSDLKGNVEQPAWYFESPSIEKNYALDLVMLTHGWSRYQWNKIPPIAQPIAFHPESGFTIEGQIISKGKLVASTPFTLMFTSSDNEYFEIFESDSLGRFSIPGLNFSDTTLFSWRVMGGKKGMAQNAEIQLYTTKEIPVIQWAATSKIDVAEKLRARYVSTGVWNPGNARMLDEVVVKAQRIPNIIPMASGMVVKPDEQDLKSRISTSQFVNRYAMKLPFAILKTMPDGLSVWGFAVKNKDFVPVVLIINGIRAETTGLAGNPQTILSGIPIEQVERVYTNGPYIAVWTRNTAQEGFGTIKTIVNGYDVTREFYHPRYGPASRSPVGQDNRVTLYWNANLKTDQYGKATAKFYNTDSTKKLHVVVEGVADGSPFSTAAIIGED